MDALGLGNAAGDSSSERERERERERFSNTISNVFLSSMGADAQLVEGSARIAELEAAVAELKRNSQGPAEGGCRACRV